MQKKQYMVFRLDDNVIITLLAVCIVASLAFVIRYKNYKPCTDFDIDISGTSFQTGTLIRFSTNVKDFKRLEWNFGDNQQQRVFTETASSMHSYDAPGQYVITLIKDGRCYGYKTITIEEAPEIVDSTVLPVIKMPDSAYVGDPVTFEEISQKARSWDWRYGDANSLNSSAQRFFTTRFMTEGVKTISVTINGSAKAVIRRLVVLPKKPSSLPLGPPRPLRGEAGGPLPPPILPQGVDTAKKAPVTDPVVTPEKKYPGWDPATFNQMMRASTGGKGRATDYQKYFCDNNINTTVILNGNAVTFQEFFEKVKAVKKADDLSLHTQIFTNPSTNCVVKISVIAKVKAGLLKWSQRNL